MPSSKVVAPSFDKIDQMLKKLNALTHAAEAHGLISGFICAGQRADGKGWLEPILGDAMVRLTAPAKKMLIQLYDVTCHQLNDMDLTFRLLLPDDEQSLSLRAEALSKWCQGFLTGLGLAGVQLQEGKTDETRDALTRFSEIAQLDHKNLSTSEEDETAFIEILEYVRMAVLVIHGEFLTIYDEAFKEKSDGRLH